MLFQPALSTSSNKAYICLLLAFSSIKKYLFLPLVVISRQKTVLLCFENKIPSFEFSPATAQHRHEKLLNKQFLYHFWFIFHGSISKTTHLKDGLFSLKIAIPTLRDISVPTNWNDYKFFSMTPKVLEIDMMVYNMTKN